MKPVTDASERTPPQAIWLGRLAYADALQLQNRLRMQVLARGGAFLLGLEHPPVVTLGRRAAMVVDVPDPEQLRRAGIEIALSDRGGGATFHAPGQLIVYTVMRVNSLVAHVERLAGSCVQLLHRRGVHGAFLRSDPGVWIERQGGRAKIASIGLHVHRRVATHGMAINVSCDLEPFGWIVACQTPGLQVTSLTEETGRVESLAQLFDEVAAAWLAPRVSAATTTEMTSAAAIAAISAP